MPVCYISETVLQRAIVGPAKSLDAATHINLQYRKLSSTPNPIKKIEKMDLIPRCRELNLAFNAISRIENLLPVRQLRILNLAENRIRSIEGLEQLELLEMLDVSGNQISCIPSTLSANQNLIHLRLSRNKLTSLDDFHHLSSLANLSKLDVYENPCMKIPHSRLFIIFVVPTIDVMDGESVLISDRQAAVERFDRSSLNQLQQQLRAITDLHADSLKKLAEAESQLHADERVLSDLRAQLERFARREESQIAHIRDLEAMIERNAATISRSQARIAELEQQTIKQQTCTRCENIEFGLAAQLAKERGARVEAEKQLEDMENVMNHQLKIARGLLAAKSQRFMMEEKLRSMKAAEDATPWKAASQSLLILCESLQTQLDDYSAIAQAFHDKERRCDSLINELDALHLKDYEDRIRSSDEVISFANVHLPDGRSSKSQMMIRLRRIVLANARLRSALIAERERKATPQNDWLNEPDVEELQLKQRKSVLREEIAQLKRHLADSSRPVKKFQKDCKTQTAPENDGTLASVFACRERTLLERNNLLESELKQATAEIVQLRASFGAKSAFKEFGNQVCQDLLSLQKTRRWVLELQSYKSQLEERDAQIRYLIERFQKQPSSKVVETVPDLQPDSELFRHFKLDQINAELDNSVSSVRNRFSAHTSVQEPVDFTANHRTDFVDDAGLFAISNAWNPKVKHLDPFDKKRFMKVMESTTSTPLSEA